PYVRTRVDACARLGMMAEELVRATLPLTANGDVDAVNDCFALELVEQRPRGLAGWATMGPGDVQIRSAGMRSGRYDLGATWIFERDPDGVGIPAGEPVLSTSEWKAPIASTSGYRLALGSNVW